MTGTAITEAGEFHKIYKPGRGLDPDQPADRPRRPHDTVYRTEPEKWKAIVDEIERLHEKGQPVLVGRPRSRTPRSSPTCSTRRGVTHEVLNAKNHEREATIVAKAGEKGAVTVSTNMAGRGTDIKLGGNFEWRLKEALDAAELVEGDLEHLDEVARVRAEVREKCDADEQEVLRQGGLYVLGTERHESRRIDNQLRGRSGRQGNVGESRFFLSLQDPLMRRFYKDWVTNAMEKLGMSEGVPIESPMVGRAIQKAQKKVEDYHFEIRKNLLEYDEVMDEQRKTVYGVRQEVLQGEELEEKLDTMFHAVVPRMAETFEDDSEGFQGWYHRSFGIDCPEDQARRQGDASERAGPRRGERPPARSLYGARRRSGVGKEMMAKRAEQYHLAPHARSRSGWTTCAASMPCARASACSGYAQKDPKNEYKHEGFELFKKMLAAIEDDITSLILRVQVQKPGESGGPPPGFQQAPGALADAASRGQEISPAQMQQMRQAQAVRQAQMRSASQRVPAASMAFDQKRRTDAMRAAQAQAAQAQGTSAPAKGQGARARKRPTKPPGRHIQHWTQRSLSVRERQEVQEVPREVSGPSAGRTANLVPAALRADPNPGSAVEQRCTDSTTSCGAWRPPSAVPGSFGARGAIPTSRRMVLERAGWTPAPSKPRTGPTVLVHGVSVGEVKGAVPLVRAIEERFPEVEVVVERNHEHRHHRRARSLSRSPRRELSGGHHAVDPSAFSAAFSRTSWS